MGDQKRRPGRHVLLLCSMTNATGELANANRPINHQIITNPIAGNAVTAQRLASFYRADNKVPSLKKKERRRGCGKEKRLIAAFN